MPVSERAPQSPPSAGAAADPGRERAPAAEKPAPTSVDYESTPLTRSEYIAAIVHLYRGEVYRATVQRTRLDMTTNWAVLTTAGLLAFSFREGTNPHWPLLVGCLLVSLFLSYEARRYQMFDIWRSRVRKIEKNFYGPILRRNPVSPQREWGERVAYDLFRPSYKTSFWSAMRARLLRNYWGIYGVLLFSWLLKILMYPNAAHNWSDVKENMRFGMVAWWMPLLYIALFVAALASLVIFVRSTPAADDPNEEFWIEAPVDPDATPIDV